MAVTNVTVYTFPGEKLNGVPVYVQLVPHAVEIRIVGGGLGCCRGEKGPGAGEGPSAQLSLAY